MEKLVALVAVCLALGACTAKTAAGTPPTTPNDPPNSQADCDEHSCPMRVSGVVIAYADTDDGASIVFTLPEGDPMDLQARVAKMAEWHNRPDGQHREDHVEHAARADNIEHGARLVLTPTNPGDLEALRTHVREHVEGMQHGECPMMKHGYGDHHDHGEGHGEHHDENHGKGHGHH